MNLFQQLVELSFSSSKSSISKSNSRLISNSAIVDSCTSEEGFGTSQFFFVLIKEGFSKEGFVHGQVCTRVILPMRYTHKMA